MQEKNDLDIRNQQEKATRMISSSFDLKKFKKCRLVLSNRKSPRFEITRSATRGVGVLYERGISIELFSFGLKNNYFFVCQ